MQTNDVGLIDLIQKVQKGCIQLPDFQRNWVWDDEKIRYLLASVLSFYPIGAFMFLSCGKNDEIPFQYRTIEGAPLKSDVPEDLVLDGQQRLTAVYCAMFSEQPVKTKNAKGTPAEYLYYVNIEKALDKTADMFEAIESLDVKKKSAGLILPEKQYEKNLFPLNIILNEDKKDDWFENYREYHGKESEAFKKARQFKTNIVAKVTTYKVPVIKLDSDTPQEAVCRMFENINKNGLALTVFDLLTAKFARQKFNLREDWQRIAESKHFEKDKSILSVVSPVDFLMACTLYNTYLKKDKNGVSVSCKKNDILELSIEDYKCCRDKVKDGFIEAKQFLVDEKIFKSTDLPYTTQLIPLAVLCTLIKKTSLDNASTKNKIRQWYWCGVFGELYSSSANSKRYVNDVTSVMNWINNSDIESVPKTVKEMEFIPTRLLTRQGAIHKGLIAIILQNNCRDFIKGDNMATAFPNDKTVEIHHIFPQKHCKTKHYNRDKWDCALNKTPLRDDTNKTIGGESPSKYISKILKNIDKKTLEEILQSNWIDIADLKGDNFDLFLLHRARHILDAIEKICGKTFGFTDDDIKTRFNQTV